MSICPTCQATGNAPCMTRAGKVAKRPHVERAERGRPAGRPNPVPTLKTPPSNHASGRAIDVEGARSAVAQLGGVVDRLRSANPFAKAARDAFRAKGVPAVEEISPMIEFKAAYQDRIDGIEKRRRERLVESGKPVTRPASRTERRAAVREEQRAVRRSQRAYAHKTASQAARERTATSMARVAAGEIGTPAMRTNVLAVLRDEAAMWVKS